MCKEYDDFKEYVKACKIINDKFYVPFDSVGYIYSHNKIISNNGKLYVRPLSLLELEKLN